VARTTVFVDAENARRSTWPNVSRQHVLELCCAWAEAEDVRAIVVFDGPAPGVGVGEQTVGPHCTAVGTGGETADDWIIRAASTADDYWLVTSDRALREAAGGRAERTIGGGRFISSLNG
jgi:hypothetical protein